MIPYGRDEFEKRREARRHDPPASGRACSSCGSGGNALITRVMVNGRRHDVEQWSQILTAMAQRPFACASCPLMQRWVGLYWCGVPAPVRMWRRAALWIASIALIATGADVGGVDGNAGCGCCLDVKWRLLETPRSMVRRLAALLLLALTGERVALESDEAACPYGLWPSAL